MDDVVNVRDSRCAGRRRLPRTWLVLVLWLSPAQSVSNFTRRPSMSELPAPLAQPDLKEAIEYALLAKSAEDVPPGQTVYHPGDIITITYDTINVDYTVVTTIYA